MIQKALNTLWTVRPCLAPRRDVSHSRGEFARKGRREGENRRETLRLSFFSFTLSLAVRHQSLLCPPRFAFASVCETKRLRRRQEKSLFFLSPSSKTRKTRKWPRAWLKAALVSRVSLLRHSSARALPTKFEEKGRLLAVWALNNKWVRLFGSNKKDCEVSVSQKLLF